MDIALIEPEIPGNTGSIGRVCVGTGCALHLVGKLGFDISERAVRRAGLDYWKDVDLVVAPDRHAWEASVAGRKLWLFSTQGARRYDEVAYGPDDILVFGCETRGLPADVVARYPDQIVYLPMTNKIRSLNLANTVTAALYEALRQQEFAGITSPQAGAAESGHAGDAGEPTTKG